MHSLNSGNFWVLKSNFESTHAFFQFEMCINWDLRFLITKNNLFYWISHCTVCLVIGGGSGGGGGGSASAATTSSLLRLHVFPPWRGLASPIDDAAAVRQQKGPRRLPFRRSSSPIHQQSMYVLKQRPSTKSLSKHRRTSARFVQLMF